METPISVSGTPKEKVNVKNELQEQIVRQFLWQRITLLVILGYEAAGCMLGGALLAVAPDGRLMDMPVAMMHGAFYDFMIPGIILFGLGIINTMAFVSVLLSSRTNWVWTGLAMGGLTIWFIVEIIILQELHWLHFMWGMPVVIGALMTLPLFPSKPETMRKTLLSFGILSSILYIAMNIFVPMLFQGYSYSYHTISELSAIGAPTRILWVLLGVLYAFLLAAFGWGIWLSATENRRLHIVGGFMFTYGVINLIWPITPMHLRETLASGGATISDTLHLVMAAVCVFFMMTAMGFGAWALRKRFRIYSIVTILILLVFGYLTGLDAPNVQANLPTPLAGVWERINIGVFTLWVIVFAMILWKKVETRFIASLN
jgi:hypothetical protein